MDNKIISRKCLLCVLALAAMFTPNLFYGSGPPQLFRQAAQQASVPDVKGTWSGTFFSRHASVSPFDLTVVISADSRARLVGDSTLNSDCLKGAKLQVTVTGSEVVLAGGDEMGDNITIRGTIDSSGTLLKSKYVLNGSASGKCETDDGTGDLGKR